MKALQDAKIVPAYYMLCRSGLEEYKKSCFFTVSEEL